MNVEKTLKKKRKKKKKIAQLMPALRAIGGLLPFVLPPQQMVQTIDIVVE
jgi:hypothetical protein